MPGASDAPGSYSFVPSFDDLLTEAWERCGLSPSIINGDTLRSARRSYQLMFIDWTNRGLNLWQIPQIVVTTTPGQATVALTPEIVDVLQATVSVNGQDLTMTPIGRDDYMSIPNKATSTRPTQFWVARVLPAPVLYLYPTPDQAYSITASALRQPQDVASMTAAPDAPVLWAEAITSGLAARLALKFAMDRLQVLGMLADEAYKRANGENRERPPLRIAPRMSR